MKTDIPFRPTPVDMLEIEDEANTEADREPEDPPAFDALQAELAAEIITRTAGQKVLAAQQVRERAPFMSEIERRQHALAWRAMAAEMIAAAAFVERFRPDADFVPEYLRERAAL